jgi:hypothetical protein
MSKSAKPSPDIINVALEATGPRRSHGVAAHDSCDLAAGAAGGTGGVVAQRPRPLIRHRPCKTANLVLSVVGVHVVLAVPRCSLATESFGFLQLHPDEGELYEAAEEALLEDPRFEYLDERRTRRSFGVLCAQCFNDRGHNQVHPFLALHARETGSGIPADG